MFNAQDVQGHANTGRRKYCFWWQTIRLNITFCNQISINKNWIAQRPDTTKTRDIEALSHLSKIYCFQHLLFTQASNVMPVMENVFPISQVIFRGSVTQISGDSSIEFRQSRPTLWKIIAKWWMTEQKEWDQTDEQFLDGFKSWMCQTTYIHLNREDWTQCLIADADTSKFWISLYKAKGNMWHIIHIYMSKIGEK
jgi:hypothetical protein